MSNLLRLVACLTVLLSFNAFAEIYRFTATGVISKLIESSSDSLSSSVLDNTQQEVASSNWAGNVISLGDPVTLISIYDTNSPGEFRNSNTKHSAISTYNNWGGIDVSTSNLIFVSDGIPSPENDECGYSFRDKFQIDTILELYNYCGNTISSELLPTSFQHVGLGSNLSYEFDETVAIGYFTGGPAMDLLKAEAELLSITFENITSPNDQDGDLIGDEFDNCPSNANSDQSDKDSDGIGDECDATPNGDSDSDGIDNDSDNCPNTDNADQSDLDQDSIGDACDSDKDGDDIRDDFEQALGGDTTDPNDAQTSIDLILGLGKQVPAMGGIGLLALGLSMLGLGAVRLRKK